MDVGIDRHAGGRELRSGLLVTDPRDKHKRNTLELIASLGNASDPIPYDTALLDAMMELRKDKFLLKGGTWKHDLLFWSCGPDAKMRFEYLAEWDPDCLITGSFSDLPISHGVIERSKDLTRFNMFLTTSLKHHPQHLGLLFQKDSSGKTAYERIIDEHGNEEQTFDAIKQCIPANTTLPILHNVLRDAPKFINAFTSKYLNALHSRDKNGRSLTQAVIVAGSKTLKKRQRVYWKNER